MIKFQATNPENQRRVLGLGMSWGNVIKLLKGQPIHFSAEQMGLPHIRVNEVLIYVGETEEKMKAELQEKGYLDGAVIIEEPTRQ